MLGAARIVPCQLTGNGMTLTTTGDTFIRNLTADDIDATGATAVFIESSEVANVTG